MTPPAPSQNVRSASQQGVGFDLSPAGPSRPVGVETAWESGTPGYPPSRRMGRGPEVGNLGLLDSVDLPVREEWLSREGPAYEAGVYLTGSVLWEPRRSRAGTEDLVKVWLRRLLPTPSVSLAGFPLP